MTSAEIPYKFLVNAAAPQRGGVTQSVVDQLRHAIVTLELKPGSYVLFCNVSGHYAAGQHTPFTVTG